MKPATSRLLRLLLLGGFLLFTCYPLLWMFLCACRMEGDAQARPLALPAFWTLRNFAAVFSNSVFARAYANSLLICTLSVAATVVLASMAAFVFGILEFRGRKPLFLLFLLGMMIPVHVTLIPLNRMMGQFMLKGSLLSLAGPYIAFSLPVSILILKNAFSEIPRALIDAARVDGCSPLEILLHVALPAVRPALATVVIFDFLTLWNEFAFALTLLGPGTRTLPLALNEFGGDHGVLLTQTCAALCLVVVPLVLVYIFAQRQIVSGLTAGAVKE